MDTFKIMRILLIGFALAFLAYFITYFAFGVVFGLLVLSISMAILIVLSVSILEFKTIAWDFNSKWSVISILLTGLSLWTIFDNLEKPLAPLAFGILALYFIFIACMLLFLGKTQKRKLERTPYKHATKPEAILMILLIVGLFAFILMNAYFGLPIWF